MEASLIWKKLLLDGKKITTTGEIINLAKGIGRNGWRSVKYLQSQGYLTRILKGIFYIRDIDERERDGYDHSIFEMVALALKEKRTTNWYFSLETALKINNMTHEFFNIEYVFTDSFRTTKAIGIIDTNFIFIKRGKKHFTGGIVEDEMIKYSDPEKTVLDIAYNHYLKDEQSGYFFSPVREYIEEIDMSVLRKYLVAYPNTFQSDVEVLL